jgi:hypothetical protein
MVQIHTPTVQIHTPTLHAPKTPQILTTTTTKVDSKVISKTNTTNSAYSSSNAGGSNASSNPYATGRSNTGGQSQMPPQGVRYNQSSDGKITVTIDGRTLPMNKATAQLIQEAETPPPKMWLNGNLVPVTQANEKEAKDEKVQEIDSKIDGKDGSTTVKMPKLGGKDH